MPVGRIVNRSELSETLGVSLPTIDDWLRKGCPYVEKPEKRGGSGWKIDVGAVLSWHREQERKNALGDVAQIDETEARRRKLAAEAALAEHELALKQGVAINIDDVAKVWDGQISSTRAKFLGLGHKLAPLVAVEVDALACQALIDGEIHEALAELSKFDPGDLRNTSKGMDLSPEDASEDGEPLGSTATIDRQRVGGPKPKAKSRGKRGTRTVAHQPG